MESFRAGYFDGQSSKEYVAHIFIDELNNRLSVEHIDSIIEYWALQDISIEYTGSLTEIKYGDKPVKSLHIKSDRFGNELRQVFRSKGYSGWYHKLIYAGTTMHIMMSASI